MTEYHFEINGSTYRVKVKESRAGHAVVEVNGTDYRVDIKTPAAEPSQTVPTAVPAPQPVTPKSASAGATVVMEDGIVRAPLPGVIRKLLRKTGDTVEADQAVMVLEAMKMENEIKAPAAGTIAELFVVEGDSVNTGDDLFRISQ
jgi:biotin carboxyl carrier protein